MLHQGIPTKKNGNVILKNVHKKKKNIILRGQALML